MAKNRLIHKGFTGSFEVSLEDECLVGRVLFIDDIITFEGDTVPAITAEFQAAVDRYLLHCEASGKPANKPFSGTFNVRVGADLHRAIVVAANEAAINLNEFVTQAVLAAVNQRSSRQVAASK
jgi:predicted HicB family RNase H-like nuclease